MKYSEWKWHSFDHLNFDRIQRWESIYKFTSWYSRNPLGLYMGPHQCSVIRLVTLAFSLSAMFFFARIFFHYFTWLFSLPLLAAVVCHVVVVVGVSRTIFIRYHHLVHHLGWCSHCCRDCWCCCWFLVICHRLANIIMRMSSKILFHPFWSVLFLKRDFSTQPFTNTEAGLRERALCVNIYTHTDTSKYHQQQWHRMRMKCVRGSWTFWTIIHTKRETRTCTRDENKKMLERKRDDESMKKNREKKKNWNDFHIFCILDIICVFSSS